MKYLRYLLIVLLLGVTAQVIAQGQTSGDPVLKDYKELRKFRDAFYQLYNQPVRDYDALLNAAPVLRTAAIEYSKMAYDTHHNAKHKAFVEYRDSLSLLVKAYEEAALQFDSTAVSKLLPPMQEQFEKSTAMLIPYSWPEYTRLRLSAERLNDYLVLVAKKNPKLPKFDIPSTVDTIVAQTAAFVASQGPQEIQYRASLVTEEKNYFTKLVNEIKTLSTGTNREKFRTKAAELKVRLVTFERYYLQ